MKLVLFSLLLTACVDEQNVGNKPTNTPGAPNPTAVGSPRWAISIGGAAQDTANAVGVDPAGDVIASGTFIGTVDFGGHVFDAPNYGSWISKRAAADGHEIWTRAFGTEPASGTWSRAAIAPDGSVIAAIELQGDVDLGTQVVHGPALGTGSNTVLAKFTNDGALAWTYAFDPASVIQVVGLAVASDGRVAIVGNYQGTLALPDGAHPATGDHDAFLIAFDAAGHELWGRTSKNLGSGPTLTFVAMTAEADIVATGELPDIMVFDGATLQNNALNSQFVVRYDIAGHQQWAGVLGTSAHVEEVGPVAIAANGDAVVASTQRLPDDSDGNGVPRLEALNPIGASSWTTTAVSGSAYTEAVTILGDGTTVSANLGHGFEIDVGSGELDACMYLAGYDSGGHLTSVSSFGDRYASDTWPTALAARVKTLAMSAILGASIDFGTGSLRFAGGQDAAIAVFDTP